MLQQTTSPTRPFRPTPLCMETEDQQLERLENEQEHAEMKYGLKCARDFVNLVKHETSGWIPVMVQDYFRVKQVSSPLIPVLADMVLEWRKEG